ncbi:hypothetical protein [Serratia fonticola]|uniref:hypothetical protein n=1 Tax=Serratia fonticola TaxID=47917 RepID=UPI001C438A4D|nr:hypothetical protein [Serratia fonticola]QXN62804.1 hypothetical protein J8M99_01630 [Serratia fonticola]
MTTKTSVKPVLLSGEQMAAILQIQRQEKQRSPLGISPSIHEIARGLVAKALTITTSKSN